jgi:hypothetical protein
MRSLTSVRIISTVLHWDNRDFEGRASKIENDKCLSKEQLECLKDYSTKLREEQEAIRQYSGMEALHFF